MPRALGLGLFATVLSLSVNSCRNDSSTIIRDEIDHASGDFRWDLPAKIPRPIVTQPMSEAKFELGRHLFYDVRLSGNGTMSCASCHQQDKAFSDGRRVAVGSTGQSHPRNAQALVNVAYNVTLTWANPALVTVEQQVFIPLFGEDPVEHGITAGNWPEVSARLAGEPRYAPLVAAAFPEDDVVMTEAQIGDALAVFVKGLTSFDSAYDRRLAGDEAEFSEAARRGEALFFGEKMECFHCHGGYNFSDSTADQTMTFINKVFHNTGLYNLDGAGQYPTGNRGLFESTGVPSDMGRFRAPSLRNVAKTAPYMHDGSFASLEAVLDSYAAGGNFIASGPLQGDGLKNPYKDWFVTVFSMSSEERADVVAFLESLTDDGFLKNPRFANPWP